MKSLNLALLLPCLLLSACGVSAAVDATRSLPARKDATNASIHKQTLLVALNDMLSDQNSQYLAPVPTGMLPGGQTFAEEATAEEIVKLA